MLIALAVKRETTVSLDWIARRLDMGARSTVSREASMLHVACPKRQSGRNNTGGSWVVTERGRSRIAGILQHETPAPFYLATSFTAFGAMMRFYNSHIFAACVLLTCALLLLKAFLPAAEISKPVDAYKISQATVPVLEYEAKNIFEAVNYTLIVAKSSIPEAAKIKLVIGPMHAHPAEVHKLSVRNETLLNLLRYWSELFRWKMTFKNDTITYSEDTSK